MGSVHSYIITPPHLGLSRENFEKEKIGTNSLNLLQAQNRFLNAEKFRKPRMRREGKDKKKPGSLPTMEGPLRKARRRFLGPSIRTGSCRLRSRPPQVAAEVGTRGNGKAIAHMKGLQTKRSPAASAFAAQPLGDSLKTRRLSPFCPFGAAPCLLRAKRRKDN